MILEGLRKQVLDAARQMSHLGLVRGTSGNVSARDAGTGLVAITPSSLPYDTLEPGDIVVVDLSGKAVDLSGKAIEGTHRPSSETPMHTAVYRARPDVLAVMHTHSPHATAFGVAGSPLPAVTVPLAIYGPVLVALFELPGTVELAGECVRALGGEGMAVLLQNHGILTVGRTVPEALEVALYVEEGAQVALLCYAAGTLNLIPEKQAREIKRAWKAGRGA